MKPKFCCPTFKEGYEDEVQNVQMISDEVWKMCQDCGTGEPIRFCPWCGKKIRIEK